METVERFENELYTLWNMSAHNKLPAEIDNFESDRDPMEVLAEDLISKELAVDVGFITLTKPLSKWWTKGKHHQVHSMIVEPEAMKASKEVEKKAS
jgi:hypothetical protein